MKFELNDYHRNVPDEELLSDVKNTALKLDKDTLTADEYTANGKYHSSTISHRFGTWNKALNKAGLSVHKEQNYNLGNCNANNDELIKDLKSVANELHSNTVTRAQYNKYGKFSASIFQSRFKTWENALKSADLDVHWNHSILAEDLLSEIERVWILLGRQPTSTDIKNGVSKYSLQSYSRRFGGWRGALQAFVDWVNTDNDTDPEQEKCEKKPTVSDVKAEPEKADIRTRKTSRDINLRLRFRVMQRDNFKCCMCGASPAKDPSVELHIDHIIPWAKGGETTFDNLQTLCSKCNLGKSDLLLDENT